MADAVKANYSVVMLPLKDEYVDKFDDAKATAFFHEVKGLPYGYHNYVHEWVDAGINNLPWKPTSPEIIVSIFTGIENAFGNGTKLSTWALFMQAINHRLSEVTGQTIVLGSMGELFDYILFEEKITDVAGRIIELVNMPEQDTWIYDDNPQPGTNQTSPCTQGRKDCSGPSMICEVYLYRTYKAAGLWGADPDALFQAGEVDPRSAYQADIFNTSFVYDPTKYPRCAAQAKESGTCQLTGWRALPLPGVSSIPITPHFAETCQDLPPNYARIPSGC